MDRENTGVPPTAGRAFQFQQGKGEDHLASLEARESVPPAKLRLIFVVPG